MSSSLSLSLAWLINQAKPSQAKPSQAKLKFFGIPTSSSSNTIFRLVTRSSFLFFLTSQAWTCTTRQSSARLQSYQQPKNILNIILPLLCEEKKKKSYFMAIIISHNILTINDMSNHHKSKLIKWNKNIMKMYWNFVV